MSYLGAGKKFMDVVTYSGNGSIQSIGGLDFSPDLVWVKSTNVAADHVLQDTVRGTDVYLMSSQSAVENSASNYITSFDSNGFTVGSGNRVNNSSRQYVAWCWDAGDTTVTNTDGTITSQVRANPEAGFSVVSYTGNGTDGATVGHGLNDAPAMTIVKNRDLNSSNWQVYHSGLGATKYLSLNSNQAQASNAGAWNDTDPTSSVFSLGTFTYVNNSGDDLIAYCWSEVPGFSKFGSYFGNGSTSGNFIYTGFKPRFILVKCSSHSADWTIYDTERDTGVLKTYLEPNNSDAESNVGSDGSNDGIHALSNGFQVFGDFANINNNGYTYIYAAFAELPIADPSPKTELTLASTKDWDNLVVGNTLTQPSTGLSGVIESKDLANSKITLSSGVDMETGSPTTSPVDGSGTVVSFDISTNSMVLENVTGGFAANRGKFLEGSIRRLPKYQSETSVLTGVEDVAGYQIANSLRFDGTSTYLSRTPGADGNHTTWTFSTWFKRGKLVDGQILNAGTDNENRVFVRLLNDSIAFEQKSNSVWNLIIRSDETFTDSSAWYHLVVVYDSNNATETDRARVYVNGERLNFTAYSPTWPTQGLESEIDLPTAIGTTAYSVSTSPYNGYLSDVQFVDGQALDCFAFGEFNPFGQWIAKSYSEPLVLSTIDTVTGNQLSLANSTGLDELNIGNTVTQDSDTIVDTSVATSDSQVFDYDIVGRYAGATNLGAIGVVGDPNDFFGVYYPDLETLWGSQTSGGPFYRNLDDTGLTLPTLGGAYNSGGQFGGSYITWYPPANMPSGVWNFIAYGSGADGYDRTITVYDGNGSIPISWSNAPIIGPDGSTSGLKSVAYNGTLGQVTFGVPGHRTGTAQCKGILFNGKQVLSQGTLVFPDSQGFDAITVGDIVSGSETEYTMSASGQRNAYPPAYVWAKSVPGQENSQNNDQKTVTYNFGGIPGSTLNFTVGGWEGRSGMKAQYNINNSGWSSTYDIGNQTFNASIPGGVLDTLQYKYWFTTSDGGVQYRGYLYVNTIDGKKPVIVDSTTIKFTDAVRVAAVDAASNTITVDQWTNGFGTGDSISTTVPAGVGTVTNIDTSNSTIDVDVESGQFTGGEGKYLNVATDKFGDTGYQLRFPPEDIGLDTGGRSNNWTPNNFTADDTTTDSPTDYGTDTGAGGEVRSNYCTPNPLVVINGASSTITDGNLVIYGGATNGATGTTINPTSGKYYFEAGLNYASGQTTGGMGVGIVGEYRYDVGNPSGNSYPGSFYGFFSRTEINSVADGTETGTQAIEPTSDYMLGIAVDFDARNITLYVDGVEGDTISFPYFKTPLLYFLWGNTTNTMNVNFGQMPFVHSAPAGYLTLNTKNLP